MQTGIEPIVFDSETELLSYSEKGATFVDAFSRQIKELFFIDNPSFIGSSKPAIFDSAEFKSYAESKVKGYTFVYYPWNNHVVKTVTADDYFRLKTNRNQDLITKAEQEKLRDFRVGVCGMSVGSNIAFVLTQAGVSQEITIADFDELDTTNLNRILGGVHQIGLPKTVIAARRIYEDNPFARVQALHEGVSEKILRDFLRSHTLDCLVDEIDDIAFKISLRKIAREHKIPVLMITDNGDGVVLHVERYDLGLETIFDKDDAYWENRLQGAMSKELAGDIIIKDIVGGFEKVDPKMIASVSRVLKKELVSWSQLGSAALLGGVVATVAIKRIALGESSEKSIREFINPPLIK